ncbi:hypothetical protein LWI29_009937 [Acer saccharum]|uniref:Agenet domain-containing protein n=1 Tax=Acer saccharum TaxID=4024 RepID=A0AA39RWU1_ACESA|nr:hypothetical protein LWI29_009937 [Acer saccharum]
MTSEDEETTMGSDDSGSVFVRGSLVEVTSNLDGYRGVWFVAKVLETPPPNLRRSSRTMTFLVEYQTLLSKDGKKLLREHVSLGLIRPLPPPPREEGMHRFQVNDVVDGYYNDGWWVGVVCHVMRDCEAEDSKPYTVLFDDPPDSVKFRPSELRFHLDWVDGKWVQPPKRIMQQKEVGTSSRKKEVGTSSRKRKRGERPKFLLRECVDSSSKAEDIEMAIVPSNMVYADEPLSICQPIAISVDSSICDRTVNQSSEGEGRLCDTREATIDNIPYENQSLRLLESSSSIRSSIQSMEVFRLMPQKPHFRPLNECNEIIREGLAIAQWFIFAKVVEQTSELQVDASRSLFDSIVECLSELESHGFDVKAVRSRLLELQTMKESQEQLQTKLENFKCEIVERTHKKTKIKAEMDDAAKELKVLEEKIDAVEKKKTRLVSMIKENDSTTAKLKSSDDLVNKKIWKVVQNFEILAGSPW